MTNSILAHPLTRGLDIDDPRTTLLRRQIIQTNRFLRAIYLEWYGDIVAALPPGEEPVLELGSGAGFLSEFIPGLITSEIFNTPGARVVMDAHTMPMQSGSLRGIVMTNVLHHLARPRSFFAEAARCVMPGGAIAMIEPWVSSWATLIYTHLHHEPFLPKASEWEFPQTGPLSGANGALPWILFVRDRAQFEREFPMWEIRTVRPIMPFRYLISGGVSRRALMPHWSFGAWRALENCMRPWMHRWGMFAQVVLNRRAIDRPRTDVWPGANEGPAAE
jgi:SAM-dependent methyltransferase